MGCGETGCISWTGIFIPSIGAYISERGAGV